MVEKNATIYTASSCIFWYVFSIKDGHGPRPQLLTLYVVAQKFRIVNCGPTQKLERRNPNIWRHTERIDCDRCGVETVHDKDIYHANDVIMNKLAWSGKKKQSVPTRFSSSLLGCMERS